jgi:PTS system galactitol-specific IIA component
MSACLATSLNLMQPMIDIQKKEDILELLSTKALEEGYVTENFSKDLLEREKTFPTGLAMSIPIALAHVGTNCLCSFLALATLRNPVQFGNMDGSDTHVHAKLVFVFGIVKPEEQVIVLQKLGNLFNDSKFLKELSVCDTQEKLLSTLKSYLGGMLNEPKIKGRNH